MKSLFRIAWHFWTNTKYSGEVSSINPVDIHQELTQCVRTWIFSKCQKHWDFTLCPSLTVANALSQGNIYSCLRFLNKYLVFLKELNDLFREIVQNFWLRQASSFLKTVPGCRVCRHFLTWKLKCTYYHMNMYISQPLLKVYGWKNKELLIHYSDFITITPYLERFKPLVFCWWS